MKLSKRKSKKAWQRSLSALSINLSGAWLGVAFVGPTISFPQTTGEFLLLILYVGFAIVCLLASVWLEKEMLK